MGLCGSSAAAGGTTGGFGDMMTKGIQDYVMNLVVQRAAGSTGDQQMGMLKGIVGQVLPKAKIEEQIVPNAPSNMLNLLSGGEVVHNSQQSGPVEKNADSIMAKLTSMATQQMANFGK